MRERFRAPRIHYGPNPVRVIGFSILLVAAVAASAWFAYSYAMSRNVAVPSAPQIDQGLLEQVEQQRTENAQLLGQVAALERTHQIDAETTEALRNRLRELRDEKRRLSDDLAFYKSIVAPEDAEQSLQIQNFKLERQPESSRFRYQIVLTRALAQDSYVKGVTRFEVYGDRDGASIALSLVEISSASHRQHYFRFKYFQNIDGVIELPEGFTPLRVDVEATVTGEKEATITRSFEWPQKRSESRAS